MGLGLKFMVGVRRPREAPTAARPRDVGSRSKAGVRVYHDAPRAAVVHSVIEKRWIFNPEDSII
jgi:hypothetical protein